MPERVTSVHVTAVGGHGGNLWAAPGGMGAVAVADVPVTAGATLYVEVGGNGADVNTGGFNGGGGGAGPAAGGGGASDVRTLGAARPESLASRLVVAGGGGGSAFWRPGAAAGTGVADLWSGQAGTPAAGGVGGIGTNGGQSGQNGSLGIGGAGGPGGGVGGAQFGGGGGGAGMFGGGGGGGGGAVYNPWGGTQSPGGAGGGGSSGFAGTATHSSVGPDASGTPDVTISFVVPPPADVEVVAARARATGVLGLRLRVSGPGRLAAVATARHVIYGRAAKTVAAEGTKTLEIRPTAAARRFLREGRAVHAKIEISYTTTDDSDSATARLTVKPRRLNDN
ncbi:MAG TPA: glycine-rich protein [Solirubrobacter sp.]